VPPVDQTRWEATNTQSLECCVHLTRLPRSIQPLAALPKHANDGNASRPPPLRYTPLRDLRSVPLRVVGLLSKLGSRPRQEGAEGGVPPTAVPPPKTRSNSHLARTPKQGNKAQIRETPRLSPQTHATDGNGGRLALLVQNFVLPYTPLRKLRSVPLRIAVGATDDCRRSSRQRRGKRQEGCGRGSAPYRRTPRRRARTATWPGRRRG